MAQDSETSKGRVGRLYEAHGVMMRYLVVGLGNTAFSYLMFLGLLVVFESALGSLVHSDSDGLAWLGAHYYLVAQWVGWVLMVPVSTTTMKYIAFRSPGPLLPQVAKAYLVYLPAQALSSAILWLTVSLVGLPPAVGQLIVISIVTVFTYLGHKYFTFRVPLEAAEFGDYAEAEPEQ